MKTCEHEWVGLGQWFGLGGVIGVYLSCLVCLLLLCSLESLVGWGIVGMFIRRDGLREYFYFYMMTLVRFMLSMLKW
jgi:hypothetical protein